MAITKSDVENWIKELMPYVIHPNYLAPKGCMPKGSIKAKPGDVIEYDQCLMANQPEVIDRSQVLETLVGLYSLADEDIVYSEDEDERVNEITLDDEFETSDMVI